MATVDNKAAAPKFPIIDEFMNSNYLTRRQLGIFRVVSSLLHVFWFAWMLLESKFPRLWAYFTIWSFALSMVYFVMVAFLTSELENDPPQAFVTRRPYLTRLLLRIMQIVFQVAFSVELMVAIVFWGFLYNFWKEKVNPGLMNHLFNIFAHTGIMLLLWAELLLSQIKFIGKDYRYVVWYLLIYGLFNFIYSITVENLYPILTFKDARTLWSALGGFIISLAHFYIGLKVSSKKMTDTKKTS